ncbi:MAG: hypothetical protein QM668_00680 [Agriterribacter sp.]
MKLSNIQKLLLGEMSIDNFTIEINEEVNIYKKSLLKKGASATIYLEEDLIKVKIDRKSINTICNFFIEGKIDNYQLNYMIEALLLSSHVSFANEKIRSLLEDLTDPEYGLKLDIEYVKNIVYA